MPTAFLNPSLAARLGLCGLLILFSNVTLVSSFNPHSKEESSTLDESLVPESTSAEVDKVAAERRHHSSSASNSSFGIQNWICIAVVAFFFLCGLASVLQNCHRRSPVQRQGLSRRVACFFTLHAFAVALIVIGQPALIGVSSADVYLSDNLLFYAFIALLVSMGSFVHTRAVRTYHLLGFSMPELFTIFWYFLFNLAWFLDFYYAGHFRNKPLPNLLAKLMGHMTELNMALVLLPCAKSSVWTHLLGVSYERAIRYHRWLGWSVFFCLAAHTFGYYAIWIRDYGWLRFAECAFTFNCDAAHMHSKRDLIMYGQIGFFSLVVMLSTSFEFIRRRCYELFYAMHMMFIPFVVCAAIHCYILQPKARLLFYLAFSGTLYVVDVVLRYTSRYAAAYKSIQTTALSGGVVRLDMFFSNFRRLPGFNDDLENLCCMHRSRFEMPRPGQYYFVNIPAISCLEWHPMSVSNCDGPRMSFHIRAMGKRSWSSDLYKLVERNGNARIPSSGNGLGSLSIQLQGPYGCLPPYLMNGRDPILIICGGIGATPCIYLLESLVRTASTIPGSAPPVRFLWVVRSAEHFEWFAESIRRVTSHPSKNFEVRLFVSDSKNSKVDVMSDDSGSSSRAKPLLNPADIVETGLLDLDASQVCAGRPDIASEISAFRFSHGLAHDADVKDSLAVYTCGPASLTDEVRACAAASPASISLHVESFEM